MLAAPHLPDLGRALGSVPAATRRQDLDALGSSYIDSGLLRDRDVTDGWAGTADEALEERIYYLQNWRADVVALVEPDGDGGAVMREWIKYSAYGVPFGIPAGDANSDGVCDATDDALISAWLGQDPSPPYGVRLDVDLNGEIDAFDEGLIQGGHQSLGRGVLSGLTVGNRKGYAGYEGDAKLAGAKWHVRHRVLDSVLGRWLRRWLRRDPLGYVECASLLQFVQSNPLGFYDSHGLLTIATCPANSLVVQGQDRGWVIKVDVGASPGKCVCKGGMSCRFTVKAGVGYRGMDGRIYSAETDQGIANMSNGAYQAWHTGNPDNDMNWESATGDVSPNEEAGLSAGGGGSNVGGDNDDLFGPSGEDELFGRMAGGLVSSQTRSRRYLPRGTYRVIHLRLRSPANVHVPTPINGYNETGADGADISVPAVIILACGECK